MVSTRRVVNPYINKGDASKLPSCIYSPYYNFVAIASPSATIMSASTAASAALSIYKIAHPVFLNEDVFASISVLALAQSTETSWHGGLDTSEGDAMKAVQSVLNKLDDLNEKNNQATFMAYLKSYPEIAIFKGMFPLLWHLLPTHLPPGWNAEVLGKQFRTWLTKAPTQPPVQATPVTRSASLQPSSPVSALTVLPFEHAEFTLTFDGVPAFAQPHSPALLGSRRVL